MNVHIHPLTATLAVSIKQEAGWTYSLSERFGKEKKNTCDAAGNRTVDRPAPLRSQ